MRFYVLRYSGCTCLDVATDPWNPSPSFQWSGSFRDCHDSFIKTIGSKEVLVSSEGYADTFSIVDVTDKRNLQLLSTTPVISGTYMHSNWITDDNKYLFGFEENNAHDILVFDITDLTNPEEIHRFQWSGEDSSGDAVVHNGAVHGNYLLVAYYQAGFRVFDISNPMNPIEVGMYDTYQGAIAGSCYGAWNVYSGLPSGNVLLSSDNEGTFVFNVEVVAAPAPPTGFAVSIAANGHQLDWVAADTASGYSIYRGLTAAAADTLIAENIVGNSYLDPDLTSTYYYRVTAKNAGGESIPTDVKSASTSSCSGGTDCDDGDACTTDTCNSGTCAHAPVDCGVEVCLEGVCVQCFEDVHCEIGQSCVANVCSACTTDGSAECPTCPPLIPFWSGSSCVECLDNSDCTDLNVCNGAETCGGGGSCQAGVPLDCGGTFCLPMQCDAVLGCQAGTPPNCLYGCDDGTNSCVCSADPGASCISNTDCCEDTCNGGVCTSCAPLGAVCVVDADCCATKCKGPPGAKSCR